MPAQPLQQEMAFHTHHLMFGSLEKWNHRSIASIEVQGSLRRTLCIDIVEFDSVHLNSSRSVLISSIPATELWQVSAHVICLDPIPLSVRLVGIQVEVLDDSADTVTMNVQGAR